MFRFGVRRKKRYEPLTEISVESAIAQSADLLNNACEMALKEKDFDSLGRLSERWLTMGIAIKEISAEMREQQKDNKQIGFSNE